MPRFIVTVQVFDHGYTQEADAERARERVERYLANYYVPAEVTPLFAERVKELRGEDDFDAFKAAQWEALENAAYAEAREAATIGWANPAGASVQFSLSVED